MSEAFDFESHDRLLGKCVNYNLRGNGYDWLKNNLTNRIQYVEATNHNSDLHEIALQSEENISSNGVPHTSIHK